MAIRPRPCWCWRRWFRPLWRDRFSPAIWSALLGRKRLGQVSGDLVELRIRGVGAIAGHLVDQILPARSIHLLTHHLLRIMAFGADADHGVASRTRRQLLVIRIRHPRRRRRGLRHRPQGGDQKDGGGNRKMAHDRSGLEGCYFLGRAKATTTSLWTSVVTVPIPPLVATAVMNWRPSAP